MVFYCQNDGEIIYNQKIKKVAKWGLLEAEIS